MRRITIAAVAGGAALALAACGDDADANRRIGADAGTVAQAVAEPNGLEKKTGSEVMTAAAAALREAGSVRVVAQSGTEVSSFDLRIESDSVIGTITEESATFDVVFVDGSTYMRTADPASIPEFETVAAGQWAKTDNTDSFNFESLSLDGLVEEFEGQVGEVDDAVEQTTEAGQPVVAVTNSVGDRFLIASAGEALPVSETHTEGDLSVTYSEYGEDFDIKAPADFVTL